MASKGKAANQLSSILSLGSEPEEKLGQMIDKLEDSQKLELEVLAKRITNLIQANSKKRKNIRKHAKIERKTKETQILVELDIDGTGEDVHISTGIGSNSYIWN